jgi:3-phenylpropionate/cinnamic acid dioxygenase small subunit
VSIAVSALRDELENLYADYAEAIDGGTLEHWPDFFVDPCLYRIVSKENFDKGLPLSLMRCESLGMLKDRAFASEKLNVYGPRAWRHAITQIRAELQGEEIAVRANFAVFETLHDEHTRILCTGAYRDRLVRTPAGLKFREKICVYDAALIPGSIVMPI